MAWTRDPLHPRPQDHMSTGSVPYFICLIRSFWGCRHGSIWAEDLFLLPELALEHAGSWKLDTSVITSLACDNLGLCQAEPFGLPVI